MAQPCAQRVGAGRLVRQVQLGLASYAQQAVQSFHEQESGNTLKVSDGSPSLSCCWVEGQCMPPRTAPTSIWCMLAKCSGHALSGNNHIRSMWCAV